MSAFQIRLRLGTLTLSVHSACKPFDRRTSATMSALGEPVPTTRTLSAQSLCIATSFLSSFSFLDYEPFYLRSDYRPTEVVFDPFSALSPKSSRQFSISQQHLYLIHPLVRILIVDAPARIAVRDNFGNTAHATC